MVRTRLFAAALVAALGLIAAGCGGGDNGGGDQASPPPPPASSGSSGSGSSGSGQPAAASEAVKQAVAACKQSVQTAPVSDDVKGDLEDLCEKAASGDEQEVREASKEVCRKIVEETVPEGASRDQALTACDAANPSG